MKFSLHELRLPLEHTFRISRNATEVQRSLVVEASQDGVSGWGESTVDSFYGHTVASMSESVRAAEAVITDLDWDRPESLWEQLSAVLPKDRFALSAIDQAVHDLYGKLHGRTTREVLGLTGEAAVRSSYTIGIDRPEVMIQKLRERPGWPAYKVKLGTDRDVEIVRRLRAETDKPFRVDANCGWTVEEAIANSHHLASLGVEFIEQPLPADATPEDHHKLFEATALPLVADESCRVEADVAACHGRFHGINVKLCKCGGLTPAARMLREARALGMQTMIGCMVESSIGISAAAQLLPLLDHADLDGAVLLASDPACGVNVQEGRITFPAGYGTGARLEILAPEVEGVSPGI